MREMNEFTPPTAQRGPSREITPAFIMDLFPCVRVHRTVQGNSYAVSAWNGTAKRWQPVDTVPDTTQALSLAARIN